MKKSERLPIFRSTEQARVLAELFVFADAPLSLSELADRTGISVGGAHKEVERLEAAGLVRSSRLGRARLVEANPASPFYVDLRRLLTKAEGPETLLRSALSDVDGIDQAFIYGSWADPGERSPADIDVLVVGEPDVGVVYDAISSVETEVGRPVNVTIRSSDEWDEADGPFERAIRTGPHIDLR